MIKIDKDFVSIWKSFYSFYNVLFLIWILLMNNINKHKKCYSILYLPSFLIPYWYFEKGDFIMKLMFFIVSLGKRNVFFLWPTQISSYLTTFSPATYTKPSINAKVRQFVRTNGD